MKGGDEGDEGDVVFWFCVSFRGCGLLAVLNHGCWAGDCWGWVGLGLGFGFGGYSHQ